MNLPNKLTIIRMLMIPFFLFFLLTDYAGDASNYIAVTIFIVASLTDLMDGKIARKYNLVTNFGKFMDPIADKLLVCSGLIAFVGLKLIPSVVVIIIIAREFIVSGLRLVAADEGIVLAAGMWGKIKTTCQMIMCILLIVNFDNYYFDILEQLFIYASLALTIISVLDYFIKNKDLLSYK